jgi:hypothetical protein
MKIQFNTDKTITGNEKDQLYFNSLIADGLENFESHISRIEVHLSDENGKKEGLNSKRCLLETRLEGRQPIAVSCQADTVELALSGAIDKLTASLDTIIGSRQDH